MQLQKKILDQLTAVAFADPADFMTVEEGKLLIKDWQALTKNQLAAVAGVERSATGLKLKLYDKMKALELLGKLLGLFDGGISKQEDNNLLEAIVAASGKEVDFHDLPEIQQTAESGADLVESTQAAPL